MVDKDQHARRLQWLSARKSVLVSAGGVNRYRALKLQCLANAQAEEDKEDTGPLLLTIKRKKEKEEEEEKSNKEKKKKTKEKTDMTFSISRKETSSNVVGKKS
ncbi:unnamed protein product [Peronospora destructor]|uniref:Uncharacterized protein n=1 Tax=Peronospora destructor TaxID=86335 RepID=A0AAV0TMB9_9STRA|nr:unnamed protein product [Peronospora destructor]